MNGAKEMNAGIPSPREQVIPSGENLFKSLFLVLTYLGSFFVIQKFVAPIDSAGIKWSLIALISIWNAMLMLGMGVLSHEAVHGVLFRSRFWNDLGGGLLAAMLLIPLEANRQFHTEHHRYAHQPGLDPENPMHQTSFLFAVLVGPFIALAAQYRVLVDILVKGDFVRVLKDVLLVGVTLLLYLQLLPALGISLSLTWAPAWVALVFVFSVRALADHYGIPPVVRDSNKDKGLSVEEVESGTETRREVTGWVVLTPKWLQWLWSHVNYHEVHHKYPYLSHKYLAQAFEASRRQYPYLVVKGYWRSLLNVSKRAYYGKPEDVKAFRAAA